MSRVPAKRWATREDLLRQIETVREWIDSDPGRYSLDQLAALAAISQYHFQRLFKATYGKTPHSYLTEARLQKAMALLKIGQMTVQEICIEVGYSSHPSFSQAFKKRFGIPPSSMKRRKS